MSKFSVKRPMTIFVAAILIIVMGLVSFMKMTPDLMPNMNMPYMAVLTAYPGATPQEVSETISKPMEKSLATLENIENVKSVSNGNYSLVMLEFGEDVNMDTVSADILQKINMISYGWDEKIGTPTILKLNPSMLPVSVSAVSIKGKDREELSSFVENQLMGEIEGITGVASVESAGILTSKINIVINQEKIDDINNKMLDSINGELAEADNKIRQGERDIAKAQARLNKKKAQYEGAKDDAYDKVASEALNFYALQEESIAINTEINTLQEKKASIEKQIESGLLTAEKEKELKGELDKINKRLAVLEKDRKKVDKVLSKFESGAEDKAKEAYKTIGKLQSAKTSLDNAQSALDRSSQQIASAKSQLNETRDKAFEEADLGDAITIESVSQLLQAQNFSMPAGYVGVDDERFLVSVGDKFESINEVKKVTLFDDNEALGTICIDDVADVFMADNGDKIYAKINGEDGVLLSFFKQSNYPTAEVCDNISDKFDKLEKKYDGLKFERMMDQGYYIKVVIKSILGSLIWGAVFAIIILLLFLKRIKPTLITVFSIPVSIIFAITLMYFSGISLNMISLSGLAVAVGMLVDNSIVVMENTMRLKSMGVSSVKAAIAGAKQMGGAITASTLTTMCVFVPMVFTEGITRELFSDMALTIGYSLVASLVVAMTLVPALSSTILLDEYNVEHKRFDTVVGKYLKLLNWSLRHRGVVLCCALLLFCGSVGTVVAKGFTFMPDMATPQMEVSIQAPEGSKLEETMKLADDATEIMRDIKEVKSAGAILSGGDDYGIQVGESDKTPTQVMMYLILDENTKRSSGEIAKEINSKCSKLDGKIEALGGATTMEAYTGESDIIINVYGDDSEKLQKVAVQIGKIVKKSKGTKNVDNGLKDAYPEIHFTVDKKEAIKYGLTVAQVYQQINSALSREVKATTLSWNNNKYDVIVIGKEKSKITPSYIKNYKLNFADKNGEEKTVRLKDIADVEEKTAMRSIDRLNQRTYLEVTADVEDGYSTTTVTDGITKTIEEEYDFPEGVTYESKGLDDTIYEALVNFAIVILLGLIMIYLIMVAQFQSLKSPFIIMFTIPLAFTGGLLGLLVTGKEISVISMIGFVMLAGIIVNNGIVLIDYINQLRAKGMDKMNAIVDGAKTRIRPVIMTSLTTVFGLMIMAIGKTAGTDLMQPVAIVCIGGLLYATLLTLFVVPVLYHLFNKGEYKVRKEKDLDISDI